jgi:aldose 1-epimerase
MHSMNALILSAGDMRLEVLPTLGGAVTRFTLGDFPIFRETAAAPGSVSDAASFPLIPFSNRVRAGRFKFGHTSYQIPVDKRDARFANHGHTRHLPWQVIGSSTSRLTLRFSQAEPEPAWPFPFTAEQQFELSPSALTMRAKIRNDHVSLAPAGIGFHPYFTRQPGTTLRFSAECVWEADELDISVRSAVPGGRFGFAAGKVMETPLINHAYGGWDGKAEIIHPSSFQIDINATDAFNHLVLFTPEGRNFFGFEPVSHRPDALNPLADLRDQGMAILSPGEWMEGSITITILETP